MENEQHEVMQNTSKSSTGLIIVVVVALALVGAGLFIYKSQKNDLSQMAQGTVPTTQESITAAMTQQPEGKKPAGMEPQQAPAMTDEQSKQAVDGVSTASTKKTFTVDGGNFYFVPNSMKVNKGDSVTVVFKNDGGMHNFVLDDFAVKTNVIKTGESESVTFTADKTGTYEYYCSVGQHRAMGMKGTLIVQ